MSLCISPRFRVRVGLLIAAAMVSWPFSAGADTEHLVVVIVPSFRPASPMPPAFSSQPPLQWAPPPAMGLTPGLRSPTARCYAGANVCPLAQPEHVGASCSCGTAAGTTEGRALIPPSHDIAGRLNELNVARVFCNPTLRRSSTSTDS